ncbi:7520_t:CDS:2 [Funneliformis geosporum]|nr:7520_t:CDS:2 [Funneliformis geosporum]
MQMLKDFSRDIGRLLESTHNSHDVIIRAGVGTSQKEFKAHSLILNARCPYFQKVSTNGENVPNESGIIVFDKQNFSPKIFKILLKYFYTGRIELKDQDTSDILQILMMSDELELTTLIQHALHYLIENQSFHLRRERKDKSAAKGGNPVVKISKLIRVSNPQKAIYYSPTSGPCFGGGCDLGIINNQIVSYGSLSYNGINKFIKEESHLDLEDYEVFQVVKSE